ncbi:MAG: cysteine synthase family protein [Chloroflexi bacterium]|nr:cysteine synthase family protein [Chloroflexota bacterium]MCY4245992.1 cysteine synthase family protein [Chloroflexota bacterium]
MTPTAEDQLDTLQTTALAQDIERQVGNTALLSFRRITRRLPAAVRVFAKAEWQNPGGSVKDRAALSIIQQAERAGQLYPGRVILDSTSGNTGIAYAMIGAAKDYRVKLFLPENVSPERVAILRAYDVQLTYTDPLEGSDGAIRAVRELAARQSDKYFYADQYNNPANWQAHYRGTGAEIWRQTAGQVSHFVAGLGTSGTLVGAGRRLKELNPALQVVSVEPDSPFHGLEGLKHMGTALQPGIYDPRLADRQLAVRTEEAHSMALRLAREEGYLVGISAAAAMTGALRVAEGLANRGEAGTVVTLFPDNAYKYLSEAFWRT